MKILPWAIFGWIFRSPKIYQVFRVWGLKSRDFLLQKAHPCANPSRLSHFVWKSIEGSDPQRWARKKTKKPHYMRSRHTSSLIQSPSNTVLHYVSTEHCALWEATMRCCWPWPWAVTENKFWVLCLDRQVLEGKSLFLTVIELFVSEVEQCTAIK